MKKFFVIILCVTAILFVSLVPAMAEDDIKIMYCGKYIRFDTTPYISGGRIMAPVRGIFESVGADVTWDDSTKTATAVKNGKTVTMTLGSSTVRIDGEKIRMDASVEMKNDRIFAPARYVAMSFDKKISFHDASRTAVISDSNEYTYYSDISLPVPRFDWLNDVGFLSDAAQGNTVAYKYSCTQNSVTDYLNFLQLDFGYSAYNMVYGENSVTYTYVYDRLLVDITEYFDSSAGHSVVIVPDTQGIYGVKKEEPKPKTEPGNEILKNNAPESGKNSDKPSEPTDDEYSEVDFGKITGEPLLDTIEKDGQKYYVYSSGFFASSYYGSYIESHGWKLYDYKFDIDSFSQTKYYLKGESILCVSASYIRDVVMVALMKK